MHVVGPHLEGQVLMLGLCRKDDTRGPERGGRDFIQLTLGLLLLGRWKMAASWSDGCIG